MPTVDVTIEQHRTVQYPIVVEKHAWDALPAFLRDLSTKVSRAVIVADETTAKLFGERVESLVASADLSVAMISFPAGEANKIRETKRDIEDAMLTIGCGRDTVVIALGGGVVGDLAGYVAATYARGIPVIQLPTTLLAMVDSAIGGKTGVDTEHGKNLIGAFHQPIAIFSETATLVNLPDKQFVAGMWEAIKMFLTYDAAMFEKTAEQWESVLKRDEALLDEIILRAAQLKAEVVARDEKEGGERAVLNFGHTVGHALELVSEYSILHGEAVALGCMIEAKISHAMGYLSDDAVSAIDNALTTTGIDRSPLSAYDAEALIGAMKTDKKNKGGKPHMVLLSSIGSVIEKDGAYAHLVEEDVISAALTN